jgi:hypothetical protein
VGPWAWTSEDGVRRTTIEFMTSVNRSNMADTMTTEMSDPGLKPFDTLPSLVGVEKSEFTEHVPIGGVASSSIEFQVQSSSAGYFDLAQSYFHISLRIQQIANDTTTSDIPSALVGGSGDSLVAADVGFVDLLFASMKLYINGVDLSDDDNNVYPWVAFWKKALREKHGFGDSVTRTNCVPTFRGPYWEIAPATTDEIRGGTTVTEGKGYREGYVYGGKLGTMNDRYEIYSNVRESMWWFLRPDPTAGSAAEGGDGNQFLDLYWKPQQALFDSQPKYLPPNIDLRMVLTKGSPNLPFRCDVPSTQLRGLQNWNESSMRMYLRRVYPTSSVREELAAAALSGPYIYPFVRTRAQVLNYAPSTTSIAEVGLLSGPRPNTVVVAFYDSRCFVKAYDGGGNAGQHLPAHHSSGIPFSWYAQNATFTKRVADEDAIVPKINEIYVRFNGRQVPLVPFRSARETDKQRAYEAYKRAANPGAPALSYSQFVYAHTCYVFNLSEDETRPGAFESDPSERGSVEVYATITPADATGTEPNFSMLVMGLSDALLTISSDRSVRRIGF